VTAATAGRSEALSILVQREEVLQISYWYKGEGFGEVVTAAALMPFLTSTRAAIDAALEDLVARGLMAREARGFRLTQLGLQEGARLFADAFAEFQTGGHGECATGCCDGDDHSQCTHH
jgi:hypothetical protein